MKIKIFIFLIFVNHINAVYADFLYDENSNKEVGVATFMDKLKSNLPNSMKSYLLTSKILFSKNESEFQIENEFDCSAYSGRRYAYINRERSIVLNDVVLRLILYYDEITVKNCPFSSALDLAQAVVIHELAHLYDLNNLISIEDFNYENK